MIYALCVKPNASDARCTKSGAEKPIEIKLNLIFGHFWQAHIELWIFTMKQKISQSGDVKKMLFSSHSFLESWQLKMQLFPLFSSQVHHTNVDRQLAVKSLLSERVQTIFTFFLICRNPSKTPTAVVQDPWSIHALQKKVNSKHQKSLTGVNKTVNYQFFTIKEIAQSVFPWVMTIKNANNSSFSPLHRCITWI